MPTQLDINALRLDSVQLSTQRLRGSRRQRRGSFLKGPIPWQWLKTASMQPGKALHVGIAIWRLAGLTASNSVRLTRGALADLGVQRLSAYRGVQALERAGLIVVERHRGRCPIITILESSD